MSWLNDVCYSDKVRKILLSDEEFLPWKFYFPSLERFWKVYISAGSYRPLPHKYVESVSLARARLTLSVVLVLYSLDHIGDLPGESSQPLLRIV